MDRKERGRIYLQLAIFPPLATRQLLFRTLPTAAAAAAAACPHPSAPGDFWTPSVTLAPLDNMARPAVPTVGWVSRPPISEWH